MIFYAVNQFYMYRRCLNPLTLTKRRHKTTYSDISFIVSSRLNVSQGDTGLDAFITGLTNDRNFVSGMVWYAENYCLTGYKAYTRAEILLYRLICLIERLKFQCSIDAMKRVTGALPAPQTPAEAAVP